MLLKQWSLPSLKEVHWTPSAAVFSHILPVRLNFGCELRTESASPCHAWGSTGDLIWSITASLTYEVSRLLCQSHLIAHARVAI